MKPRVTIDPQRPDEVLIHLPEFTYLDTHVWSMDVGVPASELPALRDAIDAHLAAAPVVGEQPHA